MKRLGQLRIAFSTLVILMAFAASGWAQLGKIYGTVSTGKDLAIGEKVELWKDNQPTGKGTYTNDDGRYEFSLLEPGSYTIKVVTVERTIVQNITLSTGEYKTLEFQTAIADGEDNGPGTSHRGVEIVGNRETLFTVDPMVSVTFDQGTLQRGGPGRGIQDFASLVPCMVQKDAGDPLNFKGGRSDANATYIDNVKLRGSDQMPLAAIEQMTVITGGLPAEYGDVTGAVIVVTTRNPGMSMGHTGKPMTKTERKLQKQLRKKANGEGGVERDLDGLACN